uniref:Uncharacterized protein n=1 Tax=Arundo donax TaxID=35708 RepID=A0A0A9B3G0_ARUDO
MQEQTMGMFGNFTTPHKMIWA